MRAVHFGAGNIGRGFIGEILAANGFEITFVDVNETIIAALQQRKSYTIELADENREQIFIEHVTGINNAKEPDAVVQAIVEADILTTAIGPAVLLALHRSLQKGWISEQSRKRSKQLMSSLAKI